MCADLLNLEKQLRALEKSKVDYVHIDVMDAHFVPNLTFGIDTINAIAKTTVIPLDVHLLVKNPIAIARRLHIREGFMVTAHIESDNRIEEVANLVRSAGAKVGLALNPETTVESIRDHLRYIDVVLLMLTPPGFAGLQIIPGIMGKVTELNTFLQKEKQESIEIEVDGGVGFDQAEYMSRLGATVFVGGTSSIFKDGQSLDKTVPLLRSRIQLD